MQVWKLLGTLRPGDHVESMCEVWRFDPPRVLFFNRPTKMWIPFENFPTEMLFAEGKVISNPPGVCLLFDDVMKALASGDPGVYRSVDGTKIIKADAFHKSILSYDGHGGWGDDPDCLGNYQTTWIRDEGEQIAQCDILEVEYEVL